MTFIISPGTATDSSSNNSTSNIGGTTTLNESLSAGDTTITLTSTSEFPSSGTIKIDSEYITYSGKSGNDLTGCTRGSFDTTDASHTSGVDVKGCFVGTSEKNSQPDVMSTVSSNKNGVFYFDYSDNGTTWYSDPIEGFTILENVVSTNIGTKSNRHFRVRFENSSSQQITSFNTNTYFGLYQHGERTSNGELKVFDRNLPRLTQFEELNTVQRTQVIELKSTYGLSNLRDVQATNGDGAITNTIGTTAEYNLSTGSTAASYAILVSAERGRYVPGFSGQIGIGVRIPTDASDNQVAYWGLFDTESGSPPTVDNGFYYSQTSSGLFVNIASGGTVTSYAQADWNADKLDGTGGSGVTLDLSRGNIFQVDFTWYGYGTIEFIINVPNPRTLINEHVVVHRYRPNGSTSTLNPNLPISAMVYNGATVGGDYDMYVAGRQYSIIGQYRPNQRITAEYRSQVDVDGTFVPMILVRRKSAYTSVSVKLQGLDILSTADLVVQVRTGISISAGSSSFGALTDVTASETALESNLAATSVTGGELIWSGLVAGSNNKSTAVDKNAFEFDLIGTDIYAILVKRVTGTNATVDCIARFKEEW